MSLLSIFAQPLDLFFSNRLQTPIKVLISISLPIAISTRFSRRECVLSCRHVPRDVRNQSPDPLIQPSPSHLDDYHWHISLSISLSLSLLCQCDSSCLFLATLCMYYDTLLHTHTSIWRSDVPFIEL